MARTDRLLPEPVLDSSDLDWPVVMAPGGAAPSTLWATAEF
jgi:hypothetical protein